MPAPNQSRGAKSRRNLKKGGPGRPKITAEEKEIRKLSKALLRRPGYRKTLASQLDAGTLHPSVHVMLYYYAHGKPVEIIETRPVTPVRIVHDYAASDDDTK